MKIVFIGTPEFGAVVLDKLCQTEYRPVLVITAPDKPIGRTQAITPPPVKLAAKKYGIPILQPESILNLKSEILKLESDLIITAAFGQILSKEILTLPKYGCLNVHPSLLPKFRGASPIQHTILNGETKTGVSIMLMDEKMDHGPILAQRELEIRNPKSEIRNKSQILNSKIAYEELHNKLAELGANLLVETIPKWIKGGIEPIPQNDAEATYTKILKKEDGRINWENSAEYIERQIRAFDPWPGTYSSFEKEGQRPEFLKILKATALRQTENGPFGSPGKTYPAPNDKIAVQCGKDYLIIDELQPEGKKKMSAKEFIMGRRNFIGTILK